MLALHVFCEQLLDKLGGTHMVNIFAAELQLLEADMELFLCVFVFMSCWLIITVQTCEKCKNPACL